MSTRKFLPATQNKMMTIVPSNLELLLQYASQVYSRVSSPEQKKNVSAEMQQDKSFAVLCGWVANKKVYSEDGTTIIGYTIASDRGLRGLLSNPTYAGYWIYNNVVVSSENHEPIVEYGLFLYAFNRLSPYHLDGSPNGPYLEKRKQYVKKHRADKPALLKNHIEAGDPGYVICPCSKPLYGEQTEGTAAVFYGFYPRKSGVRPSAKYMIPALDIDGFFLERFIERLQDAEGFENFLD